MSAAFNRKDRPGFAGLPCGRPPDAGIRPDHLANERDRIEGWLRDAVGAGNTGAPNGGFPLYLRHGEGDTVFEAHGNSPGSGCYHGYLPRDGQHVRGLQ